MTEFQSKVHISTRHRPIIEKWNPLREGRWLLIPDEGPVGNGSRGRAEAHRTTVFLKGKMDSIQYDQRVQHTIDSTNL